MVLANGRDANGGARGGRGSEAALLLAAEEAVDVGAGILRRGRANLGALISKGDRDFATGVDLQIETAMRRALATAAPAIPLLGEEEGGAPADGSPRWVLDPIDGTINFAKGSPLCTISLSLVVEGQPVLGIVDAPLLGERFIAQRGGGAFLNGARLAVCDVPGLHEAVVAVADFKVGVGAEAENRVHLAAIEQLARRALRVRMHGSAALDLAWLAAGRVHATIMLSNLPWDVTAGLLIVREAGGRVCDADGSPHNERSRCTIASTPSLGDTIPRLVAEAM
jgi:myo-inositol-1(or 4)-monophosphatase